MPEISSNTEDISPDFLESNLSGPKSTHMYYANVPDEQVDSEDISRTRKLGNIDQRIFLNLDMKSVIFICRQPRMKLDK